MPTESDLRAALHSLEREAPTPAAVLARQDPPPRRRWVAIVAVATTTAAIAAAVPTYRALTAAEPNAAGTDTARPPVTTWRYSYTLKPPAGWGQVAEGVMPEGQLTTVSALGGATCTLFSFERGRLDARVLTKRQPVTIPGGRKGFIAEVATWRPVSESRPLIGTAIVPSGPRPPVPPQPTPRKRVRPVVAFEYAPDSWRVVDCAQADGTGKTPSRDQTIDRELRVAGGVSDRERIVRSPFSLGFLPAGWPDQRAADLGPRSGSQGEFQFNVYATGYAPSRLDQSLALPDAPPPDANKPSARGVTVTVSAGGPSADYLKGTRTTVNGHPAYVWKDSRPRTSDSKRPVYRARVTVDGHSDHFFVVIESMTTDADYTPELIKIAKGLRLVDNPVGRPSTVVEEHPDWFNASEAFPKP